MTVSGPPQAVPRKDIRTYRRALLLAFLVAAGAVIAVTAAIWPPETPVHKAVVWTGIVLMLVCIVGRTWSRLYINARKTREVVSVGPYSVCRNPLYDFTILGTTGAAAQTGSLTIAAVAALAVWCVFVFVVRKEEQTLLAIHGEPYRAYLRAVPRFLPRLSAWRDIEIVEVRVQNVTKTLLEGFLFLAAVPAAETVNALQSLGTLPVVFSVY